MLTETDVEIGRPSLHEAAFGIAPECWPLPAAHSPHELWLRAVGAAGQGRYASARCDLAALRRQQTHGPSASLAHSAHASFLRQLGHHRLARGWDGRALALAGNRRDDPRSAEAANDALVGLAADALGVGRLKAAGRFLECAKDRLTDVPDLPRLKIRMAWVSAELALAGGDGESAVRHAQQGVELAEAAGSYRRHRIKSDLVLAAALCMAGSLEKARTVADTALADAEVHGLLPLQWALACVLSDIGSDTHPSQVIADIRAESSEIITRRGGQWCGG